MSFELTRAIVDRFNSDSRWGPQPQAQALNFVCGALVAYDAAAGKDPYQGLDVERVFAAVELLARRRDLEVTPFVAAWHPAVNQWDRPELPGFWDKRFRDEIMREHPFDRGRDQVVSLIRAVTAEGSGEVYSRLMTQMVSELVHLIATTPKQVDHLAPLVSAGRPPKGLTVATLNYDLSVEHAGESAGIPVYTGIEDWTRDGRWRWPGDGIRLLKLHGSINWAWQTERGGEGQMARTTVGLWSLQDQADQEVASPALVFGHGAKLKAQGPFLSLLAEFERLLETADRLVVVGYSFRDEHINEVFRRWVTEDRSREVTVIDPFFPENPDRDADHFRYEMKNTLAPGSWGSHKPPPPRLHLIRKPASAGFRDLFLYSPC